MTLEDTTGKGPENPALKRIGAAVDDVIQRNVVHTWPEESQSILKNAMVELFARIERRTGGRLNSVSTLKEKPGILNIIVDSGSPIQLQHPQDIRVDSKAATIATMSTFKDTLRLLQNGVTSLEELKEKRRGNKGKIFGQ